MKINDILEKYPLRVSLTDFCNLNCFFCSNEGMDDTQKNTKNVNLEEFKYLIDSLHKSGLKNLSITGGEPTLHPNIKSIIQFLDNYKFDNLFFHTNGINLDKEMVDLLVKNFNKIAVSVHSVDFESWHRLTGGTQNQFSKLFDNLKYLSELKKKIGKKLQLN
jgi:cyclic pyranopterin phosphate synthase